MKQVDLAVVIPTINRSPKPNYLSRTLTSLAKSVETNSNTDNVQLFIVDELAFSNLREYPEANFPIHWRAFKSVERQQPYLKIVDCLKVGDKYARKWVLLLEDDVIVCKDFFGSVLRWLDADRSRQFSVQCTRTVMGQEVQFAKIVSFGSAYPNVKLAREVGFDGIMIPANEFYGTQAIAMRPETALDIARYLESSPRCKERPGEYDLAIADWVQETQPDFHYIGASCPSFVQHIGRESSIREGGTFFEFDSFPGEDWKYEVKL